MVNDEYEVQPGMRLLYKLSEGASLEARFDAFPELNRSVACANVRDEFGLMLLAKLKELDAPGVEPREQARHTILLNTLNTALKALNFHSNRNFIRKLYPEFDPNRLEDQDRSDYAILQFEGGGFLTFGKGNIRLERFFGTKFPKDPHIQAQYLELLFAIMFPFLNTDAQIDMNLVDPHFPLDDENIRKLVPFEMHRASSFFGNFIGDPKYLLQAAKDYNAELGSQGVDAVAMQELANVAVNMATLTSSARSNLTNIASAYYDSFQQAVRFIFELDGQARIEYLRLLFHDFDSALDAYRSFRTHPFARWTEALEDYFKELYESDVIFEEDSRDLISETASAQQLYNEDQLLQELKRLQSELPGEFIFQNEEVDTLPMGRITKPSKVNCMLDGRGNIEVILEYIDPEVEITRSFIVAINLNKKRNQLDWNILPSPEEEAMREIRSVVVHGIRELLTEIKRNVPQKDKRQFNPQQGTNPPPKKYGRVEKDPIYDMRKEKTGESRIAGSVPISLPETAVPARTIFIIRLDNLDEEIAEHDMHIQDAIRRGLIQIQHDAEKGALGKFRKMSKPINGYSSFRVEISVPSWKKGGRAIFLMHDDGSLQLYDVAPRGSIYKKHGM